MIFCYKCDECKLPLELDFPIGQAPSELGHVAENCYHGFFRRDYAAEHKNFNEAELRMDNNGTRDEIASLVLPDRKFFERRYGRYGENRVEREIKDWNESHEPERPEGGKFRPK